MKNTQKIIMKTYELLIIVSCLTLLITTQSAKSQDDVKDIPLSAAVLDFQESAANLDGVGSSISALLQAHLTIHSNAILVERAELDEIFSEQELSLSGAVDASQAAKIGQLTGAEVLVSGRVFEVQDRIHIVSKVISSSTSRVFGATASYDRGKPLDNAVEKLSKGLAKLLKEKKADLRAKKSLDKRVAEEMKSLLKDNPKGKIYVHIPETIINTVVPDPAAQTELAKVFQEAGWKQTENREEADLSVTGEAFAETGIRRGNLWFSRARLEIIVKNNEGEIIKSDRVVCGNVDLVQSVSGKGALQKAGLLAAPIVAKSISLDESE